MVHEFQVGEPFFGINRHARFAIDFAAGRAWFEQTALFVAAYAVSTWCLFIAFHAALFAAYTALARLLLAKLRHAD